MIKVSSTQCRCPSPEPRSPSHRLFCLTNNTPAHLRAERLLETECHFTKGRALVRDVWGTCTRARVHRKTHFHIQHTHIDIHYTHTHTHRHTQTDVSMLAHAHAHTHTYTHTHTHSILLKYTISKRSVIVSPLIFP